jgi:DNA-binding beta-propeller fold protein YncE
MPPARLLIEELGSAYRRATTTPGGTNCRSELALYSLTERPLPFHAEPTHFDLSTMRVLATYNVGRDPDVLAFDPGTEMIYVAAESGQVSVFQDSGKSLVFKGELKMPHAHSVSVDPQTHLVYFPLENLNGHPVLRIMVPAEK